MVPVLKIILDWQWSFNDGQLPGLSSHVRRRKKTPVKDIGLYGKTKVANIHMSTLNQNHFIS